jgi:hypothetical protein
VLLLPALKGIDRVTVAGASGKTVVVPSGFAVPDALIQRVESLRVTLKYVENVPAPLM